MRQTSGRRGDAAHEVARRRPLPPPPWLALIMMGKMPISRAVLTASSLECTVARSTISLGTFLSTPSLPLAPVSSVIPLPDHSTQGTVAVCAHAPADR